MVLYRSYVTVSKCNVVELNSTYIILKCKRSVLLVYFITCKTDSMQRAVDKEVKT